MAHLGVKNDDSVASHVSFDGHECKMRTVGEKEKSWVKKGFENGLNWNKENILTILNEGFGSRRKIEKFTLETNRAASDFSRK